MMTKEIKYLESRGFELAPPVLISCGKISQCPALETITEEESEESGYEENCPHLLSLINNDSLYRTMPDDQFWVFWFVVFEVVIDWVVLSLLAAVELSFLTMNI